MSRLVHGDVPVLILGETGVGKEQIARALHASGDHRHGPFVAVNCAAIPADLLEAEMFGIGKGGWSSGPASSSSSTAARSCSTRPLVILAHSLGSVMISNYIWDIKKKDTAEGGSEEGGSDFENMKTLAGFVSFGSTLPLFSFKQISTAYEELERLQDREIDVGGALTSWNPLSHRKYWTDNSFTRPVSKLIADLLEVA